MKKSRCNEGKIKSHPGGVQSILKVIRESEFERSGMDIAEEIEIFSGASNKLTIGQTYSKKFHCTYLLHYFPFDSQVHICLDKYFDPIFY